MSKNEQLESRSPLTNRELYSLLLWSAVIGFVVGSATAIILRILDWGIEFLWHDLPHALFPSLNLPLYTIIVCSIGGLLIGLCQHYLGDHPKPFEETMATL